jgi:hypothetical protein
MSGLFPVATGVGSSYSIAATDFDGNGMNDLVVPKYYGDVDLFLNQGRRWFSTCRALPREGPA